MKRESIIAIVIFTALFVLPTMADTTEVSRKERRLREKIEQLNAELHAKEDELARELILHGVDTTTVVVVEEIAEEPIEVIDSISYDELAMKATVNFSPVQMDSLLGEWRERSAVDSFDEFFKQYICLDDMDGERSSTTPPSSSVTITKSTKDDHLDSIFKYRLRELASPVALPYNSIVKSYISKYISPKSELMDNVMTRSKYYFPFIEEELMRYDLPTELRAMAIIESALTSTASSYAGAVGLWQFMPTTGKSYDLEVNYLVDERCDPLKATVAACRFLSDLYNIYGDWSLVIAAYNCGPGNVNKAMARSGLKEGSFWDIYYYLPYETRGYVPAFIAASYAYAYHQEHDVKVSESPLPLATDTIVVDKILHFGQVAETLDIPVELIRQLNPQYRRDIIPATTKSYTLRLPQRYVASYIENEASIHAKDSTYLKQYIDPVSVEKLRTTPNGTIYVVKSGDTLGAIARKYRVTTRQLMVWNNLKSANKLSIGQRLKVGES